MNKSEFEKDLEIDIDNLEVEAMRQPELYFKYSSLAQEAREEFDLAKMNLGITEAELSRKVRLKPKAFGMIKLTEPSIKEAVATHPEQISAYKKMIKARSEADLLNKAQEAMEQRKRMLELLVTLLGREYFAGPSMPHTSTELWNQVKKKKGEETQKKMVKRTRKRKRDSRE